MVANAKLYNEENSGIVEDANKILKAVTTFMKKENPAYKNAGYVPYPTPIPGEAPASQRVSEDIGSDVDADGEIDDEADSVSTPTAAKRRGRPRKNASLATYIANSKARSSGVSSRSESQAAEAQFPGMTFQQAQDRIVSDMLNYKKSEE